MTESRSVLAGTVIEDIVEDVAGNPVENVEGEGPRTILVSDLHVPSDGGKVFEMFQVLLADAAGRSGTRLVVLGDMFDAYTGPKQASVGIWRETAAALRRTTDAGVEIYLMHGNRDFMLDRTFGDLSGCRVVAGGLRLRLGGQRFVLLHGDELCQRDLPYQRAKRFLRNPVTKSCLRHLPLGLALRLAERARRRSSTVIASGDQTRFDPVAEAVADVFRGGCDVLVFGHIHRPARGRFGDAGEYVILPAFDESGVHLAFDEAGLRYRDLDGREVPDYPPREFC